MRLARTPVRRARIEIVPMIDTIFFLLVFFMMSTLSMVQMKGLNLTVPRSAVQDDTRPQGEVRILIDANAQLLLNDKPVAIGDLPTQFGAAIKAMPKAAVVLTVDAQQKCQALVSTMDLLNEIMTEQGADNPILINSQDGAEKP